MATNENLIPIPGRLHSVASDKIVSGANEIYDDELQIFLNDINNDVKSTKTKVTEIERIIGSEDTSEGTIINRINNLELSVGEGGSVNQKISDAVTDEKNRAQDIEEGLQDQIIALNNGKQVKLSVGAGITLTQDGVISATADPSIGKVVESRPTTDIIDGMIYLVPTPTAGTYYQYIHHNGEWNDGIPTISLGITTDDTLDSTSSNPILNAAIAAQIGYFVCGNSYASSEIKDVDALGFKLPDVGGDFKIKMNEANTHAGPVYLRFNLNNNTKAELKYNRESVSPTNTWEQNEIISVFYDGSNYQASNALGGYNNKINSYIYGDLKTLDTGLTYNNNEYVLTVDKRFFRIVKDIKDMNLIDTVNIGDLKVYDNNTYKAQKIVSEYKNNKIYNNEDFAIGAPTIASLVISRNVTGGNVIINFGEETYTVVTESSDELSDIINKITQSLSSIEDWTFTSESNTIIATSINHGNFSEILFTIDGETGTGVIGTVEVTTQGTDDSEEALNDGTSTVLTATLSLGVGNVDINIGDETNTIEVTKILEANDIVSNIVSLTTWNNWILSVDNVDNTKIIATSKIPIVTEVPTISSNIFGVTGTGQILFTETEKVCVYDGESWSTPTLAEYASNNVPIGESDSSKMWKILTYDDLLSNIEPNSITKSLDDIYDELKKDEYVLATKAVKENKLLEEKFSNIEEQLSEAINEKLLTDVEYVVAKTVSNHERRIKEIEINGSGGESSSSTSSLSGTLTSNTSDTICVIGSSFGIGYTMSGKHWVNILDMFSDYSILNLSEDGASNATRLYDLREKKSNIIPHKSAKYALLVDSENMKAGETTVYDSFINLAKVIMSYGITPICGTSYRNIEGNRQYHLYFSSLLRKWCKDNNTIFMDAAQYRTITGAGYRFDDPGNTHLGNRQIPLVAYAYMDALHGLERPFLSLKTYTKRNSVTVETLDDLIFTDNYERAQLFKRASSFNGYALISAILPATTRNLTNVTLSFSTNSNVKVYVINTNTKPYPVLEKLTRFHVSDNTITIPSKGDLETQGDKYTYNGTTFTVMEVFTGEESYGGFCDIYCSPTLSSASNVSGVLTKVGDSSLTIPFNGYGIASLESAKAVYEDSIGHWEEIEPDENGRYVLTDLIGRMFIDKIHFLVECNGNFSLSGIRVDWNSSLLKTNIQRTPVPDFTSNLWNINTELIPGGCTFGSVGTTQANWKDDENNSIVSEASYEYTVSGSGKYPSRCSSLIKLYSVNDGVASIRSMNTVVPYSSFRTNGKLMLEIIARYFGDNISTGFVDGNDTITTDSFDWCKLIVSIDGPSNASGNPHNTDYKCPIGLFWKIIRIPIDVIGELDETNNTRNMSLSITADKTGVEVAKVSLKYI